MKKLLILMLLPLFLAGCVAARKTVPASPDRINTAADQVEDNYPWDLESM